MYNDLHGYRVITHTAFQANDQIYNVMYVSARNFSLFSEALYTHKHKDQQFCRGSIESPVQQECKPPILKSYLFTVLHSKSVDFHYNMTFAWRLYILACAETTFGGS